MFLQPWSWSSQSWLKCFRVTIAVNTAECTQRLITRLTFRHQRSFSVSFVYVLTNRRSMLLLWMVLACESVFQLLQAFTWWLWSNFFVWLSIQFSSLHYTRIKTLFMNLCNLSNSNIQDIRFLMYYLTIIVEIWQRKEDYNILISEI